MNTPSTEDRRAEPLPDDELDEDAWQDGEDDDVEAALWLERLEKTL